MTTYGTITGRLDGACVLHGTLEARGQLTGTLTLPNLTPPVHPTYGGPYEVTPHFFEQTLETNNKLMTDDVTVEVIPAHEVTNPAGGLTVTIG
jgi:hypothetical protein